jgi:hypothetical protein
LAAAEAVVVQEDLLLLDYLAALVAEAVVAVQSLLRLAEAQPKVQAGVELVMETKAEITTSPLRLLEVAEEALEQPEMMGALVVLEQAVRD